MLSCSLLWGVSFTRFSLATTNRYAEADLEIKAQARATYAVTEPGRTPHGKAAWPKDPDLMNFLTWL
jgi:hypothetical protein